VGAEVSAVRIREVLQSAAVCVLAACVAQTAIRKSDHESSCVARNKTIGQAFLLYEADHDGGLPPVRTAYRPDFPMQGAPWPILVARYHEDGLALRCPADPHAIAGDLNVWIPDNGLVSQQIIARTKAEKTLLQAFRTNRGYNYLHLAPLDKRSRDVPMASWPVREAQVHQPERTVLCVDSSWGIDREGNPIGGGSFYVNPPLLGMARSAFWYPPGWTWRASSNANVYGGARGWHSSEEDGRKRRTVVLFVDGSAQVMTIGELLAGVSADWKRITDTDAYLWDLN
jgi:hypothetical protein